jgi:hypothetical protein
MKKMENKIFKYDYKEKKCFNQKFLIKDLKS